MMRPPPTPPVQEVTPVTTWDLDPRRSRILFKTNALWGLVSVKGAFRQVSGSGHVAPDGGVSGSLTIEAASIDTTDARRDRHLRSTDFFDSDNHPDITFAVDAVLQSAAGARVAGRLTIRKCTQHLSFDAAVSGQDDREVCLDAEVVVDREDFGITWGKRMGAQMSNTVSIHAVFSRRSALEEHAG